MDKFKHSDVACNVTQGDKRKQQNTMTKILFLLQCTKEAKPKCL